MSFGGLIFLIKTMIGLKEYIKKYGKHFTEELVHDVVPKIRWNKKQIEEALHKKVWYNVTESTIGDILYLVNTFYDKEDCDGYPRKNKCISHTLLYIGDYNNYGGKLFDNWLEKLKRWGITKDKFNFKPYI